MAQQKATADPQFCVEYVDKVLKPYAEEHFAERQWLLLADNLASQKTKKFVEKIQALRGQVAYGPPNRTEAWQPIDCGHLGAMLKALGKDRFEAWMEKMADGGKETNLQKWERNGYAASEKRILVTWVFGEAYEEFGQTKYSNLRRSPFEKGGCAITTSGKNDHLISVDNHGPVWPKRPGVAWDDEPYRNYAFTKSDAFVYSDEMPGGNDEICEDTRGRAGYRGT